MTSPSPERRRSLAGNVLLGLIVAFGIWLRLDQITSQIIADDEWHALNYLVHHTYGEIFCHFGYSDHCIPLTLFDKLVADNFGLSELWMRAPALLFGIAALIALPRMLRPRFGFKTSLLFAALLAISPLHVYFSRYARPYSAIFLLGFGGVLAFERWLATGAKRWGWIYAACAVLGPWFQPVLLPFVLAPLPFALLRAATSGEGLLPTVRRLLPFAVAIACGLALLLGPPVWTDFSVIRERSGHDSLDRGTFRVGYQLLTGATAGWASAIFAVAVVLGLLVWSGRHRGVLAYMLFVLACQAGAVWISAPAGIYQPIIAVRYMLPAVGIVLLLAAEGLSRIDELLHGDSGGLIPRHLGSAVVCSILVAHGPLFSVFAPYNKVYYRPNAWTNHGFYQYQYTEPDRRLAMGVVVPPRISAFYLSLGETSSEPGAQAERIVEAPWRLEWGVSPFVIYQRFHKRPMSIGFVSEPGAVAQWSELPWPDPRFRFRHFVNLTDLDKLREMGARYVVLHKNLPGEMPYPVEPMNWSFAPSLKHLRERFGPACFADEDIWVFDLKTAR